MKSVEEWRWREREGGEKDRGLGDAGTKARYLVDLIHVQSMNLGDARWLW
ncbi:predicted protein [Sclerotinia sclerotiorum 1980 UF-70]|uniref:Uncharacterized protein n=1 Tax=Sclerotinia sclerotiorum (strain ATCC 18683 / 1980 / Ss-1) TaxID=665079 RepID=A7F378_SCLS1|nr:predicted protein [Sclerotinia sclerotiorum 1980 UF-70]EDN97199.1 predicted protein [Sclerotinia sclerotiorum 1980 UF-70]